MTNMLVDKSSLSQPVRHTWYKWRLVQARYSQNVANCFLVEIFTLELYIKLYIACAGNNYLVNRKGVVTSKGVRKACTLFSEDERDGYK